MNRIDQRLLKSAFNLNGCLLVENVFSSEEVAKLNHLFDNYYQSKGRTADLSTLSIGNPLMGPLENEQKIANIISKKSQLLEMTRAIAGEDMQYLYSETINVGNDTHGAHRDGFFDYDITKVLICLTDRGDFSSNKKTIDSTYNPRLDGAFLVYPGSHHINGNHSAYSQYLTNWPSKSLARYRVISNRFIIGGTKNDGSYIYANENLDARYCGFQPILFSKGDVIIFSTRAVHALYPQRKTHHMKFIGMLFQEGFLVNYFENKNLFRASLDLITGGFPRLYEKYAFQPYIATSLYQHLNPYKEQTPNKIPDEMATKISKNKISGKVLEPHLYIHKYYRNTSMSKKKKKLSANNSMYYSFKNISALNKNLAKLERVSRYSQLTRKILYKLFYLTIPKLYKYILPKYLKTLKRKIKSKLDI